MSRGAVGILGVDELATELQGRGELTRFQQRHQVIDFFQIGLHGRRSEKQEEPALDAVDELPSCCLPVLDVVRLVDHDHVPGRGLDCRSLTPPARKRERSHDDAIVSPKRIRVVAEPRVLRRACDDARLRLELARPMTHEGRRRQDEGSAHHAAKLVFAQDHQRFDGLPEADLVREERSPVQDAKDTAYRLGLVHVRVDAAQGRDTDEILEISRRREYVRAQG